MSENQNESPKPQKHPSVTAGDATYNQRLKKSVAADRQRAKLEKQGHLYVEARQSTFGARNIKFDGTWEIATGSSDQEARTRIASCREAYEHAGIIGNIIDIMVDFALEGLVIEHESEPIRNFYLHWADRVGLMSVIGEVLKGIYRDGNVPILKFRHRIDDQEVRQFKKAYAEDEHERTGSRQFMDLEVENSIIPYKYMVLDILHLDRMGSALTGDLSYQYSINKVDHASLRRNRPDDEAAAVLLRKLAERIGDEDAKTLKETGRLPIAGDRVSMVYYKKDSYKPWAVPMLWRVIDDVKFKDLLRRMDISVAESVINTLTIVKLGKTVEGFAAPPTKYQTMATLLKKPAKSKTIIWDDMIEIEAHYPPVEKILGKEKYEQVNDDIRSGLGIAEVLINGTGGNFANSFLSVRSLLERLESGRRAVLDWIRSEIALVGRAMGFRRPARVKMSNMSLMDETANKKMLLELMDRNVVSSTTMLEEMKQSLDIELIRLKREDKIREAIHDSVPPVAFLRLGKFGPMINKMDILDDDDSGEPEQTPFEQEDEGNEGGRPGGPSDERQEGNPGERETSPLQKIGADLVSHRFNVLYEAICKSVQKDKKYSSRRNFTNEDYSRVNKIVAGCFYKIITAEKFTQSVIQRAISDPGSFSVSVQEDRAFTSELIERIEVYRGNNKDRPPTKKAMESLIQSTVKNMK